MKHPPVWKFVHEDGELSCYSNGAGVRIAEKLKSLEIPFSVYGKSTEKEYWKHYMDIGVQTECICGKPFTNSINGQVFRTYHKNKVSIKTMDQTAEIFRLPHLCQECFYRLEWQAGKWCPRYWLSKFET